MAVRALFGLLLIVALLAAASTLPGVMPGMVVVALGLIALPVGLVLALSARPGPQGLALTALAGYLGVAIIAGWGAYWLLPADYTARRDWTARPVSRPLGSTHAKDLARMERINASRSPETAPRRAAIWRERRDFFITWLALTAPGLALLALALARWRQRRPLHR
jgi:hypothetical protein